VGGESRSRAPAALDGVVVLDLTARFWGAIAAAMLGDFGAVVVRLEDARGNGAAPADTPGAPAGAAGLRQDATPDAATRRAGTWHYEHDLVHRNKKSVVLDLARERGRALARELAAKADVVVTDRPEQELAALGLDYARVAGARPDVVYAQGSGFGPKGPDRDLPALDELAAARTGMMPLLPQPGEPPVYAGHGQMYTSVMLAFAVAVALFHRRQTGEGQRVDASLLAGNMYGASLDLQAYLAIGEDRLLKPVSRLDAGNPMSGVLYPSTDGLWIALTMPDTDRWWPALAEVTGLDVADPRFDTHDKRCGAHRLELIAALDEAIKRRPAAHWRTVFTERQMSADVIEDYAYPAGDPSARDNRYILDLEDASLGPLRMLGFPLFMTETPARLRAGAPRRGQHSAEVLREMLGYAERDIAALEQEGVLA
jgi:crotonobetainyl-CoA:carnitine CoA-transferase CaiB-like acyl-CoA transferase